MEFLLPAVYAIAFIFVIYRWRFFHVQGLSARNITLVFLLKIACGAAIAYIYTHYYTNRTTADVFKYYDDSAVMYDAIRKNPFDFFKMLTGFRDDSDYFRFTYYERMANWYREYENTFNDSRTIIRVNAFIRLFSFGYYHVHTVFMCFLSLFGLTCIYRLFERYMTDRRRELFFAVFLLPSVLLWGSGVLKEGIMLFGLGLLVYAWHRLVINGFTFKRLAIVIFSFAALLIIKYYILASLVIALAANAWIFRSGLRRPLLKYVLVAAIFILPAVAFVLVKPQYNPLHLLAQKQNNFINLARGGAYVANDSLLVYLDIGHKDSLIATGKDSIFSIAEGTPYMYWRLDNIYDTLYGRSLSDTARYLLWWDIPASGSRIDVARLQPTLSSFLSAAPQALITTLFRPHPLEARNPFMLMAAAENLLVMLLMLLALIFFRKPQSPPLFWLCVTFVLLLFLLCGLVTPVLGALVRYKMPALPFLVIAIIMLIDREKLLRKLPYLRRMAGK